MPSTTITSRQTALCAARHLIHDCARSAELQAGDDDSGALDELPNPDAVLSVDVHTTATVLLTCGGPTIGVDFVFSAGQERPEFLRATYWTTDTPDSTTERIELTDDEAETIADALVGGLDSLAFTLTTDKEN
jgi:hypothetical protein